jgi:hypothetical protein
MNPLKKAKEILNAFTSKLEKITPIKSRRERRVDQSREILSVKPSQPSASLRQKATVEAKSATRGLKQLDQRLKALGKPEALVEIREKIAEKEKKLKEAHKKVKDEKFIDPRLINALESQLKKLIKSFSEAIEKAESLPQPKKIGNIVQKQLLIRNSERAIHQLIGSRRYFERELERQILQLERARPRSFATEAKITDLKEKMQLLPQLLEAENEARSALRSRPLSFDLLQAKVVNFELALQNARAGTEILFGPTLMSELKTEANRALRTFKRNVASMPAELSTTLQRLFGKASQLLNALEKVTAEAPDRSAVRKFHAHCDHQISLIESPYKSARDQYLQLDEKIKKVAKPFRNYEVKELEDDQIYRVKEYIRSMGEEKYEEVKEIVADHPKLAKLLEQIRELKEQRKEFYDDYDQLGDRISALKEAKRQTVVAYNALEKNPSLDRSLFEIKIDIPALDRQLLKIFKTQCDRQIRSLALLEEKYNTRDKEFRDAFNPERLEELKAAKEEASEALRQSDENPEARRIFEALMAKVI